MKTYEQSSSNDKAENYIFSSIPHFSKTQDAEVYQTRRSNTGPHVIVPAGHDMTSKTSVIAEFHSDKHHDYLLLAYPH